MNDMTKSTTLKAAWVTHLLQEIQQRPEPIDNTVLMDYCEAYDLGQSSCMVPLQVYQDICDWIEQELGEQAILEIGFQIGENTFQDLMEEGKIDAQAKPQRLLEELQTTTDTMVRDPRGKNWEIAEIQEQSIKMSLNQNFHSKLQLGLLRGFVQKCTSINEVEVSYQPKETAENGQEECIIYWQNRQTAVA